MSAKPMSTPPRPAHAPLPTALGHGLLLGAALALLPGVATAEGSVPIIIESYAGERPKEAQYYLAQLGRILSEPPHRHGELLRKDAEASVSRSAGPDGDPAKMRATIEDAQRLFIEGRFKPAIQKLEQGRRLFVARAGMVASDQNLRATLHKGLLYLAHSYLRTGQRQLAEDRMSEVIRSFPDKEPTSVQFSPELVAFYQQVRTKMLAAPRATLTVETTSERCLVFINERFVGMSPVTVDNLYTGPYRVYVRTPKQGGRLHPVRLEGGARSMTIDFALDQVFVTRPYVGLRFADREAREANEARFAAALGRQLKAPSVVVMTIRRHRGYRSLITKVVDSAAGQVQRSALVHLEPKPPTSNRVEELAAFLSGKPAGPQLMVLYPPHPRRSSGGAVDDGDRAPGRNRALPLLKWSALGVAVAGLAAGVTLLALDGRKTCSTPEGVRCPENYDTLVPGAVLTGIGAAAAVAGGVLFYLDHRQQQEEAQRSALVAPWFGPGGGGVSAMVAF